ncbi:AMP-binding protein [Paenibacillus sp. SGZ-1009]|uniref:AMP-binding protein n=1 Tax=Paenibacillus campi TaxID=3106031 RepID=UPI002AFEBFE6|nr:AMP-binding protein [Paenibacillus sp. SGZ-1009]
MFWSLERNDIPALIELHTQHVLTYAELYEQVQSFADSLTQHQADKALGIIYMRNAIPSMVAYLGALSKQDAVLLLDANLAEPIKQQFVDHYRPDWIFDESLQLYESGEATDIEQELAVLLSTSGSTGNPKLVRLSYANLQANAASIADYLQLKADERPITTLSPAYSYGLSVLNSHLLKGCTILLTDESVITSTFWDLFRQYEATSFAGVPYIYQMLHRLRFHTMELPSLRYFTQAGGRLPDPLIAYFNDSAQARHIPFFIMYGQTEATARISFVPPDQLSAKIGSIGIAILGGKLQLDTTTGELIYTGPNVMLGYAQQRADLSLGDMQQGVLNTGDWARQDEDGYFWILGRMKRFIKLYGLRMNLDDLERFLEQSVALPIACSGKDEQLFIAIEATSSDELLQMVRQQLKQRYRIHHTSIRIRFMDELPRLSSGKVDYIRLGNEVEQ